MPARPRHRRRRAARGGPTRGSATGAWPSPDATWSCCRDWRSPSATMSRGPARRRPRPRVRPGSLARLSLGAARAGARAARRAERQRRVLTAAAARLRLAGRRAVRLHLRERGNLGRRRLEAEPVFRSADAAVGQPTVGGVRLAPLRRQLAAVAPIRATTATAGACRHWRQVVSSVLMLPTLTFVGAPSCVRPRHFSALPFGCWSPFRPGPAPRACQRQSRSTVRCLLACVYPRQNELAAALREVGRIERSQVPAVIA